MTTETDSGLTLYWLEMSRSHRILWLMEELKLEYKLKLFNRDPKTHLAEPALKKVTPLGKAPVVTDNGKTVAESGLIIDYLISKYGSSSSLVPVDADEEFNVKYFLHYGEATIMPIMVLLYVSQGIRNSPAPFFIKPLLRKVAEQMDGSYAGPDSVKELEYLETCLGKTGTGYFVGNHLTGADIMLIFPLQMAVGRAGLNEEKYPLLWKWLQDMQAREAYVAADSRVKEEAEKTGFKLGKL
ncbi:glutathione S-transferase [Lipomyces arxii]|uniref:glutathione S-transferase n=1 Tax=Lipomyces arxii TaxID=56418 RepID=UPI0034CD504E